MRVLVAIGFSLFAMLLCRELFLPLLALQLPLLWQHLLLLHLPALSDSFGFGVFLGCCWRSDRYDAGVGER